MELNIYSLYDGPAQAFGQPMFIPNDGIAIRGLKDAVNDEQSKSDVKTSPGDFTLFQIGTWDNVKGTIEMLDAPRKVIIAMQLLENDKPKYTSDDLKEIKDKLCEIEKNMRGKEIPSLLKEQTV